MFPSVLLPLLLASYVSAHGYIANMKDNGRDYPGDVPGGETKPSVLRQVNDVSPVKGANNGDLFCGPGQKIASDIAEVNPGDSISFDWKGGDGSNWPHNTGPMLTYMASCGDKPCNQFDSTSAKWFKIQQVGRKGKGQDWAQADLMQGAAADLKLPSTLAPGNYLIRHEIIALHLAENEGGAEFYPGCAQLKVGGNQSGKPNNNELVTFPGGYSDNDPGILVKNAFDANADYDFPGPAIAQFVSGSPSSGSGGGNSDNGNNGGNSNNGNGNNGGNSNNGNDNNNGNDGGNNDQGNDSQNNGSSQSTTGSCKLKKRVVYVSKRDDGKYEEIDKRDVVKMYKPRHISRIMRRLLDNPEFRSAYTSSQ